MIKEFNEAVGEGEARMSRLKVAVMKEVEFVIASMEEAEAKRQEELGMKMSELIEKLTGGLEVMRQLEEELRQFSSFSKIFQ